MLSWDTAGAQGAAVPWTPGHKFAGWLAAALLRQGCGCERALQRSPSPAVNVQFKPEVASSLFCPLQLAKTQGNVFATDAILATLMSCTRSVYSWDIVVQRVGSKLFFDKRDNSDFGTKPVREQHRGAECPCWFRAIPWSRERVEEGLSPHRRQQPCQNPTQPPQRQGKGLSPQSLWGRQPSEASWCPNTVLLVFTHLNSTFLTSGISLYHL